jgi:hypothetical protein
MLISIAYCNAQDIDKLVKTEFLKNEATYQYQDIVMPRSSIEKPFTLRQQINHLFENKFKFIDAFVTLTHTGGMEHMYYTHADSVLDKDPILLSFDYNDNQAQRKYFEPNTTIYLGYENTQQKKQYLVIHLRTRGFLNKVLYTRTSLIIPDESETDDLLSAKSQTAPIAISYLTAFDTKDMTAEMEEFNKIALEVQRKLKEREAFNDLETVFYSGTCEVNFQEYGYCDWLYANERYFDAFTNYNDIFKQIKSKITPDNKNGLNEKFYEICHLMGMSKWKGGYFDSAAYYLGLAAYGSTEYQDDYNAFTEQYANHTNSNSEFISKNILSVGEVLGLMADVEMSNLREAVYFQKDKGQAINNFKDVWNFDIYQLCNNTPGFMSISYSKAKYEQEGAEIEDKSTLYNQNNIIITTNPIANEKWRINITIPNFKLGDYKKNITDQYNTPLNHSIIIGKRNILNPDDQQGLYDMAHTLKQEKRALEATLIFKHLLQANNTCTSNNISNEQKSLLAELAFHCGYMSVEIGLPEKAIPYLQKSYHMTDILLHKQEYIAMLSNTTDPRTLETINRELKLCNDDTPKEYLSLIKRRLAYILIEYRQLEEAKAVLNELLKDPKSEKFAKSELDYIDSLSQ